MRSLSKKGKFQHKSADKHALACAPARAPAHMPAHMSNDNAGAGAVGDLDPGLYVVATPIGNLADITIRALTTLASADLILCEDTRISQRLLHRYAINTPLQTYHDHNGARVRPEILSRLADGASIALISDAGTPLVSDPGLKLVRAALDAGFEVFTLPGPSAPIAALVKSGMASDRVLFAGFLPPRSPARRKVLRELSGIQATLIFFESGSRLSGTLKDISVILGDRNVAVARELTKIHEQLLRGSATELSDNVGRPRGEITLLVAPPSEISVPDEAVIDSALKEALERLPAGKAASEVSQKLGISRKPLYERAIRLRGVSN